MTLTRRQAITGAIAAAAVIPAAAAEWPPAPYRIIAVASWSYSSQKLPNGSWVYRFRGPQGKVTVVSPNGELPSEVIDLYIKDVCNHLIWLQNRA